MDKVDVLLSIYNPNEEYLIKQLQSINMQTYPEIELYVFDDCPAHRLKKDIIKREITNCTVNFLPYEQNNLGYMRAFSKLIEASNGRYIAFCDQDDIWKPDKIEKCVAALKKDNSLLVASDRTIIDGEDRIILESVRAKSSKNYESWHTGDDIVKYNIFVTFAVGMCIVMDGELARRMLPICPYTAHDKWAICCAGIEGKVSFIEEQLVLYRRHGNNVSGVLEGITSKKSYYKKRVWAHHNIVKDLIKRYGSFEGMEEAIAFDEARMTHSIRKLRKYRYIAPDIAKFEIMLAITPNFVFWILKKIVRKLG